MEIEGAPDLSDVLFAPHDAPRDQIGVSVQVLRGAVKDSVETEGQRSKIDGRREGVVEDRGDDLAREGHSFDQPGDTHQRIGDALEEEHLRARCHGPSPGLGALGIDE